MLPIDDHDLEHIWRHAASCLKELDSARLFMTGGTGFFGCWLLESLYFAQKHLNLSINVTVLTRDPQTFLQRLPHVSDMPGLRLWAGDVRDFTYPEGPFTHVIHAATPASAQLNQDDPLLMLDTIVEGTRHTLNFARTVGAKKFLLTSSGGVYGVQPPTLTHVDEDYMGAPDPLMPGATYGLGKRMAEHLCALYGADGAMDICIARCFAFVGPHLPLKTHFAIGNFIQQVLTQQPIHVAGDGSPYRSYLYAADLVIWLWTILCHGTSGRIYHVGSEDAIQIADLAHLVAEHGAPTLAVHTAKQPDPTSLPSRYVPSTQRAQQELHLKQHISLADSIQRTIAWSLKHETTKSQ